MAQGMIILDLISFLGRLRRAIDIRLDIIRRIEFYPQNEVIWKYARCADSRDDAMQKR